VTPSQSAHPARGVAVAATRPPTSPDVSAPGPPRWLIFLHIPRTAGTTFVRILERQYGADAVLALYDAPPGEEVARLAPGELARRRVLAGHFGFGLHVELPGSCRYVTFLREPVERVRSHYEFVRRQPGHYLHEAASRLSLAAYVEHCGRAEPNNDQTRLLAGRAYASPEGTWSPDMLEAAVRHLDGHCEVGLTDAFDASLVALRRRLGWARPFYVPRNAGRPAAGGLPAGVEALIRAHNALDVELHRHARERFEREAAALGDALARELRLFRALNRVYRLSRGAWGRARRPAPRAG
jgi:hypothetical protein